jgi:hypothetical protein
MKFPAQDDAAGGENRKSCAQTTEEGAMDMELDMNEFFEAVAGHILALATDDFEDKDFAGEKMGDRLMRLQVLNLKGEQCLQVFGGDSGELAEQLVLACFHNLSIEHLGALHLKPLDSPLQAQKEKGKPAQS